MATIVCGAALSHSPIINRPCAVDADAAQIARFRASATQIGQRLRETKPDVVLLFGPDHFRTLFYDMMPAFVIGTGDLSGWGDWDTPAGPFPTDPELARHLHVELLANGFDPASSRDLKVDHGITQPIELLSVLDVPIVPILINCAAPPLPSPLRCFDLGAAVGRAIRTYSRSTRVAVVGSGGLSHDPPLPALDSTDAEVVEQAIHGGKIGFSRNREREEQLMKRIADLSGGIHETWDREVMAALRSGSAESLAERLSTEQILQESGRGGQEVRNWLAVAGALGDPEMEPVFYEPISSLITGMGIVFGEVGLRNESAEK